MQRPTQFITYSTTLTESAGPAHRNTALCTRAGASLGRGSRTTEITSTERPTQTADIAVGWLQMLCPLLYFQKRIKVVPSCHLPLWIKQYVFLKDGIPSSYIHLCSPQNVDLYIFFLFIQILWIFLELPFLHGQEGGKEGEGPGVQKMEIEILGLLWFLPRPKAMLFPVQASLGSPVRFYIVYPCSQISFPLSLLSLALEWDRNSDNLEKWRGSG